MSTATCVQADGGTRCAPITGRYVALRLALQKLLDAGELEAMPLTGTVAAVSAGIVEDSRSAISTTPRTRPPRSMQSVVMTGEGGLVEVQATAERTPVSRASLDELLHLAERGIALLRSSQERRWAAPGRLIAMRATFMSRVWLVYLSNS